MGLLKTQNHLGKKCIEVLRGEHAVKRRQICQTALRMSGALKPRRDGGQPSPPWGGHTHAA